MYWQKPRLIGPALVVSHGNSGQEKQWLTPLFKAQVDILQNSFILGRHPASPLGHAPFNLRGQISQDTPHTPIFISHHPEP
jgi:hypothetical protein